MSRALFLLRSHKLRTTTMVDSPVFFERLLTVLSIFFGAVFVYWFLDVSIKKCVSIMKGAAHRVPDDDRRIATLTTLARTIASITLFFIAGSMILKTLQIDITPILTGAGILGVIASFSAQTLIRDVIAGLFILVENQYAPGMRVRVDKVQGVVEDISLRTTVIRADDGSHVFIPNGGIQVVRVMSETRPKKSKA